eukprot:3857926-Prymnesium_polylepis.1
MAAWATWRTACARASHLMRHSLRHRRTGGTHLVTVSRWRRLHLPRKKCEPLLIEAGVARRVEEIHLQR